MRADELRPGMLACLYANRPPLEVASVTVNHQTYYRNPLPPDGRSQQTVTVTYWQGDGGESWGVLLAAEKEIEVTTTP